MSMLPNIYNRFMVVALRITLLSIPLGAINGWGQLKIRVKSNNDKKKRSSNFCLKIILVLKFLFIRKN